ncbi:MAG TPA: hypothetical protein VHO50_13705, partial [Bacteroidales bacterium]|nr:hypothetical protein [Bacteroidales bacterium]
ILCISGIIGFVLFMAVIVYMLFSAIKNKNILYFVSIITILIFFSFESMLSRLAGNSFFALFSFLLIHYGSVKDLSDKSLYALLKSKKIPLN